MSKWIKKGTSDIPVFIVEDKGELVKLSSNVWINKTQLYENYEPLQTQPVFTKMIDKPSSYQPVTESNKMHFEMPNPEMDPIALMEMYRSQATIPIITDPYQIDQLTKGEPSKSYVTLNQDLPKGAYVEPNAVYTKQDGTSALPKHLQKKPDFDPNQFDDNDKPLNILETASRLNGNNNNDYAVKKEEFFASAEPSINNSMLPKESAVSKMKKTHDINLVLKHAYKIPDPTALKYMMAIFDEPLLDNLAKEIVQDLLKNPELLKKIVLDQLENKIYGNTKRIGKGGTTKPVSKNKKVDTAKAKSTPRKGGNTTKNSGSSK